MSQHTELKDCPFCGEAPYTVDDDSYGECGIGSHCEASPYVTAPVGQMDLAASKWNTRAEALSVNPLREVVEASERQRNTAEACEKALGVKVFELNTDNKRLREALEAFIDAWNDIDQPFMGRMPRLIEAARKALGEQP